MWLFSRYNPVHVGPELLKRYEGKYGIRSYIMKQDSLYYFREGRNRFIRMSPITHDRFIIPGIETTIFQFVSDENGEVYELRILHQDGQIQNVPKNAASGQLGRYPSRGFREEK